MPREAERTPGAQRGLDARDSETITGGLSPGNVGKAADSRAKNALYQDAPGADRGKFAGFPDVGVFLFPYL
ncbi:MAG: hypothetical protein WA705_25865 [Candidatus Ozemobacteraceae bacterium]